MCCLFQVIQGKMLRAVSVLEEFACGRMAKMNFVMFDHENPLEELFKLISDILGDE